MSSPDPLWGLLYESTATRPMTQEDLAEILGVAKARNEELDLTGWLTYAPGVDGEAGTFTQYLEGSRRPLRELFYGGEEGGGIQGDARHREVRVIQEGRFGGGPPGTRLYPAWRMEWVETPESVQG